MTLEQYLQTLSDMDPDAVVDELGISSEELVKKFRNKASKHFYEEIAEEEEELDE